MKSVDLPALLFNQFAQQSPLRYSLEGPNFRRIWDSLTPEQRAAIEAECDKVCKDIEEKKLKMEGL